MDLQNFCRNLRVQCLSLSALCSILNVMFLVSILNYDVMQSTPVEIYIIIPLHVITFTATLFVS